MLNKFCRKSKLAFSIIEMIVSIAIIVLVSTIFLANYRGNIRRSDLAMTVNVLAANTRLAQSYSLGLMKYNNVFPDGGWGVDFDVAEANDRYHFFADGGVAGDSADQIRQSDESLPQFKGQEVIFPQDIRIDKILVKRADDQIISVRKLAITFVPPRPLTKIYCENEAIYGKEAVISLVNTSDNSKLNLVVNFVGLVDITE